jgi:hypothetical protein
MPEQPLPADPMNPFSEGVVSMHEMFLALTAGGFTDDQAIKLLVAWIRSEPPDDT